MSEESRLIQLQSVLEELKCINRIMDKVCHVRETNHIMTIIIDELVSITGSGQGVITLTAKRDDAKPVTVVRKAPIEADGVAFRAGDVLTGWVLQHKRVLQIDDLDHDDRFPGLSSEEGRFKAILCCPMMVRGEVIGLTSLIRDAARGSFQENHVRLAGIVVSQTAQILSNAILLEELARRNELLQVSQRKVHEENKRLMSELTEAFGFENIIGKSVPMKRVLTMASKVSATDAPVLIAGDTGTGKELIARAIHYRSERRQKPFVIKNCGVKTETLLESELFGHVRGAFTGADKDKPGLFREADGGTIFLDEIGEAPPSTQVAILRVLETGEIRPIGATRPEFVNVRIISATNRDLKKEIEKGGFRQDLFFRLNTFTIEIPPLRERRDDVPLLAHYFLRKIRTKLGLDDLSLTPAALEALSNYAWPGNVRQLENELERAVIVREKGGPIDVADLSSEIRIAGPAGTTGPYRGKLREVVERLEKDIISATLKENDGNIQRTSNILGLTRKGLRDKISRYGLKGGADE